MRNLWRILSALKNYKSLLFASVISNILAAVFTVFSIPLVIPFFQILFNRSAPVIQRPAHWSAVDEWLKYYFTDIVNTFQSNKALLLICTIIIGVFFFRNLFRYLASYFITPVRNNIIRDLRSQLFSKILDLPVSFYSNKKKGDLISRMGTDVVELEWSVLHVLEMIFKSPLIILGSLVIMFYINAQLTLFVFLLLFITVFVIGRISSKLKQASKEAQQSVGNLSAIMDESISGLRVIKAYNAEKSQHRRFEQINNSIRKITTGILRKRDLSSPLTEFLGILVVVVLLWVGSNLVFNQALQPEVFFAFIFAFYQIIEPSKALSKGYYNVQKGLAAADRIYEIIDQASDINLFGEKKTISSFQNEIEYRNVSFRYPESDQKVLSQINLVIKKGATIALVGESGAGKSTLVDLLPRFYKDFEGQILLDGMDISEIDEQSLRSKIGLVTQDPVLFHDTVRNNILLGRTDVDKTALVHACKMANAHDFIINLPDNYECIIGDRGQKLSGGERQRLTIARALINNPPILIFDEATSSLDSESEKQVQLAMRNVLKDRTSIIIAHRISTIKDVDSIYLLEDGKIVEIGTHEELKTKSPLYRNFVELQTF